MHLTARGHRLMDAIKASVRGFEAQCEEVVGAAKFKTFGDVLRAIADRRTGDPGRGR